MTLKGHKCAASLLYPGYFQSYCNTSGILRGILCSYYHHPAPIHPCSSNYHDSCILKRLMYVWPNSLYVWKGFVTDTFWAACIQELQSSFLLIQSRTMRLGQRFRACSRDEACLDIWNRWSIGFDIKSQQWKSSYFQPFTFQSCYFDK